MRRRSDGDGRGSRSGAAGRFLVLIAVLCTAACKPELGNLLPPNAHFVRTFGQLYEEAGNRRLSHYVIVKLPAGMIRTISSGTIEYLPGFAEMGNCLLLTPRTYPVSRNDYSGLRGGLPSPSSLILAYCHLDETSVRQAVRDVYQRLLINESSTEWDAAANHFIARDEGFRSLDVRFEQLPTPLHDELGFAINDELWFAAFTVEDTPAPLFVNPLPYLAAAVPALNLDAVKPVMTSVIIQTSASGFMTNDIVDHVPSGGTIATPLPRHPMRIAIRSEERTAAAGPVVVPYIYRTRVELVSGTPAVKARGAALFNAFQFQSAIDLARRAFDFDPPGVSDPANGVYFPFVAWNNASPAPAEGEDFFNALTLPGNFVLDLNRVSGGTSAFPGGQYRLALTVADVAQPALEQIIQFQLEPGAELQVAEDSDPEDAVIGDRPVDFLNIGVWDRAFTDAAENNLRNGAGTDNFVARDTRRFHLRIRDPAANTGAGSQETITARLGVFDDTSGAPVDELTEIRLVETGNDTGLFASVAQMLTPLPNVKPGALPCTLNGFTCQDDEFFAHDGTGGPVADEAVGDRTHRAGIDDHVRIEYQPAGATQSQVWRYPVCQRAPESRRRVWVRATIFDDVIDVDETRVLEEMEQANIAWSPACIQFDLREAVRTLPSPRDANGDSITIDDELSSIDDTNLAADSDEKRVILAFRDGAKADVVELFMVPGIEVGLPSKAAGKADTPRKGYYGLGEKTFLFVRNERDASMRILAHELGHALENGDRDFPDPPPKSHFYPQSGVPFTDGMINTNRRISLQTIEKVRKLRSGGRGNEGNRLLRNY